MLRSFLLIALLVAAPAAPAAERTILVLGDSLSAAYGIPDDAGWVQLLRNRLSELGVDGEVVNASISGETTRGGLARMPELLDAERPAVVIIELGGNDGLRGISPAATEQNLTSMVELAQDQGARVLLVGVRLPPNYGQAFTERFRATFRAVVEKTGCAYVPKFLENVGGVAGMMQADGIHPTAEAQPRLLENVWVELEPMLGMPEKKKKALATDGHR
ncbi:arylesterase [Ectothiorhodospiraceae bacterium WFHF3C12]|nr:arylesterase [Ectothiorhodospiraceae bacterium WFHF3C12]